MKDLNKKHSPIGMIPDEWGIKMLSPLATISYGISHPLNKNLKEGVPIIGMPNVTKDGRFRCYGSLQGGATLASITVVMMMAVGIN